MEQADASPDVARLSDEEETRLSLALASTGAATERLGRAYLRARGHEGGCLAIVGFEGERRGGGAPARCARRALLRAGGGAALWARGPGEAWLRGRYAAPYLRDELLDRGVMVGDARDGHHLEQPGRALRAVWRARCATRSPRAARRRW